MIEKCIHGTGNNKRYAGGWVGRFFTTRTKVQNSRVNNPLKEIHAFKMQ